jgi:O-antigen/teichoic acid export membrane protein
MYKITQLFNRYELHIKNILYFLVTRLIAIVAFILVVPLFIEQASEEQYGLASIGFSLLTISTALDVAFGYVLIQSFGRRYARGRDMANSPTLGLFSFYLNISIGIAVFGVAIVFTLGLSAPETLMYASLAALLPALCISGCVAAIFQARNQLKPINLSRFSFELSKVFALATSAVIAEDISLIGPVMLITACIRSAFDLYFLRTLTGINFTYYVNSAHENKNFFKIASCGLHPLLTAALTMSISIGDKIIIKEIFGASSVAYYSIAYDISTKAYILVYAVNAAMLSVILHRYARRSSTHAPLFVGLYSVTLMGIFFYIPLFVFAPQITNYWLSNSISANVVPLVRIMVIASMSYLYGNVFEVSLIAMGRAKSVFFVYLVGVVVYWVCVFISSWQQSLQGFMYSYLILFIILLSGFFIDYMRQKRY